MSGREAQPVRPLLGTCDQKRAIVYLSPIIDCFDGMVISWSIGTHPDAELVNTMLDAAIETVTEAEERPVVHSDSVDAIDEPTDRGCSAERCWRAAD